MSQVSRLSTGSLLSARDPEHTADINSVVAGLRRHFVVHFAVFIATKFNCLFGKLRKLRYKLEGARKSTDVRRIWYSSFTVKIKIIFRKN